MDVKKELDRFGNQVYTVSISKTRAVYTIGKDKMGYAYFTISSNLGDLTGPLLGRYTTPEEALKALSLYERDRPETEHARRKAIRDRISKKNGTAVLSEPEGDIQQGSAD